MDHERTDGRVWATRIATAALLLSCAAPVHSQQRSGPTLTAAQWRADLDTMSVQMKEKHWDLFHTISEARFDSAVASLADRVEHLGWDATLVEIARIAALVGDGHTRLWLNRFGQTGFHQLPVRLYRFEDGWHVRSVAEAHHWAVGAEVVAIEGVPIEEAYGRVEALIGKDNSQTGLAIAPAYLVIPEVLHALGITAHPDRAAFQLRAGDETRDLLLSAVSPDAPPGIDIDHNPPGVPYDPDYGGETRLVSAARADSALWLADPGTHLVLRHLPERNALYVRLTRIAGTDDESFVAFMERSYDEALRLDVDRYILDLRLSWGGNNQLVLPAVLGLVRRPALDRPGRVQVLIGRHTFSATTTLVTLLDRMTHASFVGEPTGGRPNYYADGRAVRLPAAGLLMGPSSLYWQDSDPWDDRPWHPPGLGVGLTAADHAAGRDPVLEAALAATPEEPIRQQIARAIETADGTSRALSLYRGFHADPRHRWVRDTEAPPSLFRELGDEAVVAGRTDAAVAAWSAGAEVVGDPAPLRSRIEFIEQWRASLEFQRDLPPRERSRLVGSYGGATVAERGGGLVYQAPSGAVYELIRVAPNRFAFDALPWIRVEFGTGDPAERLTLVFYDGHRETRQRSGDMPGP